MIRRLLAVLCVALTWCLPSSTSTADESSGPSSRELRIDGRTQGTTYRVRGFAAHPLSRDEIVDLEARVEALLHRIDALMSAWRVDSEIERFNRLGADEAFTLSPENAELLSRSREAWRLTDGAFDPTIGRSIRLWGFGGAPHRGDLPTDAEVAVALADGGFDKLTLDGATARKKRAGLVVDLSGIAQGYTVDLVFSLLRDAGFESLLVEIGGEVRAGDPPPGEHAWRVGVEDPGEGPLRRTLALVHAAATTAGDYRSVFEVAGVRYSHILDPRDGRPVRTGVASATVVAPDATTADALDTALVVLGADKALALVESQLDLACLLFVRDAKGQFHERRSSRFGRWLP